MPRQDIGDFSGQYPTADLMDARNIRGNVISSEVIELAGQGGVIRTQDFVSGSEGWAIFAGGTAEFQDAILRGTITATGGEITGDMTISGNLTLSGTSQFATSDTNPRLVIDSNDVLTWYDSGGASVGSLELDSGTGYVTMEATAGNNLVFIAGGDISLTANGGASDIRLTGDILMNSGQIKATSGSVGAPGFAFSLDGDLGLYRAGTDDMRFVAAGSSVAQVTSGRFGPGSDNSISLGGSGLRWTEVWAVNGTIQTSDMRYKTVLDGPLPGLDFINKLEPFRYTWKGGKDEQAHWGLSAQQVGSLIGDEGPFRDGDILGLSYAEFVPSLILAIQELSAKLEKYEELAHS